MVMCDWKLPRAELALHEGDVHVWKAALDISWEHVSNLATLLSEDEMVRAHRFHFARDQRRFIVARGILRQILGSYTGLPPQSLRLQYGEYGKPALTADCGGTWLQFNLAHAHERVFYGLTRGMKIGIDLERVRAHFASLQIAERFFAPAEVATLKTITGKARVDAFFNCWTRKEAYIKAQGTGFSLPLDQFEVSLHPDEPAALLKAVDGQENTQWTLAAIETEPGYVAALAVDGPLTIWRCWRWSTQFQAIVR